MAANYQPDGLVYSTGFLRFDNLVPVAINQKVMALFASEQVERPVAGKPLSETYPPDSPLAELMQLPAIQGIVQSLVGPDPLFDHHAVHIRHPHEGRLRDCTVTVSLTPGCISTSS